MQLRPDIARYTPSPDPAHGSALYQNAVAGMDHFSDTAEKTIPMPPSELPNAAAGILQQGAGTPSDASSGDAPTSGSPARSDLSGASATANSDGSANSAVARAGPVTAANSESQNAPSPQVSGLHPAVANTPQQALQDAADGKKSYLYDQKNGLQFKPESLADGLKHAVQDGVVNKNWAAQHQQEFQDVQDKYQALEKAAGSDQVLKALVHGAGPGAGFAAAFPLGAIGGASVGASLGTWVGGILGAPTGPGEALTLPAGAATGGAIGYVLGGLAAGTLAAFAARKGLQALGQYSDAINTLNASAQLHPIADATGEFATLALNPLSAAEKVAGEGFSYAVGSPAVVKSISNLTRLGVQAAKEANQIGASGALAATKAVGGQLAKAAAGGLIFEGAVRPAFEGAVWVGASTLGIRADAPQSPTVNSLLQSAALGVLFAGHGIEFKDLPAGQVTSAMVRGKVREALGIPLDGNDPRHIDQVTNYLESKGVPINSVNAQALTAPLSEGEQRLYATLNAKIDAMRTASAETLITSSIAQPDDMAGPLGEKPGLPFLAGEAPAGMKRAQNRFVAAAIFPNGIADEPIHLHHPYPMYLGGNEQQILEPLPKSLHDAYHKGLDQIYPRKATKTFYDNMTSDRRRQMLRDLGTYTKDFDAKNGTNLFDAMVREGFPTTQ